MAPIQQLIALWTGWTADRVAGDPVWLPHPVVGFGRLIALCEHRLNHGRHRVAAGAVTAVTLISLTWLATFVICRLLSPLPWVETVFVAVGVFFCLAGRTLAREVCGVFEACHQGVESARQRVGRIVGRDTASLSVDQIRQAALETLAENLSDGVVAPLFWFAVGGLPAMMAYKMVNTLDSMIGYRNERYAQFGRWAARIDDVANYLPARLTALMMLTVSLRCNRLPFVLRYAHAHLSPNSGWPEAALAAILDCRFGGTHDYFGQSVYKPYIGTHCRPFTDDDLHKAVRINLHTEILMLLLTSLTIWLISSL